MAGARAYTHTIESPVSKSIHHHPSELLLRGLIHVDGLQLGLQFGRNDRCRFGFSGHEPLESAAELLSETSFHAGLLKLDKCILQG